MFWIGGMIIWILFIVLLLRFLASIHNKGRCSAHSECLAEHCIHFAEHDIEEECDFKLCRVGNKTFNRRCS